jgi:hypothetical protein
MLQSPIWTRETDKVILRFSTWKMALGRPRRKGEDIIKKYFREMI